MDFLVKDEWNKDNIIEFHNYLLSIENVDKIDFTKRVVNTNMKVLAIKNPDLRTIAKYIFKGNYISFLNIMPHDVYEETIVDSYLIGFIKDFDLEKKYISKLSKYIDNWSTVDSLKYNVKGEEDLFFNYSLELIKSKEIFERRIGVRILFSLYRDKNYIDKVFNTIKSMNNEDEYYVNMALSWLLCEMFIYDRNKTLEFIKNNRVNKFMINKAISKCNDSFRISKEDKELLKKYKIL